MSHIIDSHHLKDVHQPPSPPFHNTTAWKGHQRVLLLVGGLLSGRHNHHPFPRRPAPHPQLFGFTSFQIRRPSPSLPTSDSLSHWWASLSRTTQQLPHPPTSLTTRWFSFPDDTTTPHESLQLVGGFSPLSKHDARHHIHQRVYMTR